uniref:Uncharacterized protein n=1 Tax=Cannabis sativa TaxID=3483 RepID=A0A803QF15_CANSA
MDKKINQLISELITIRNQSNFHDRDEIEKLGFELNSLRDNHENIKKGFTRTIMNFSQLLDRDDREDFTYLQRLQDQVFNLLPLKGVKTENEILLVMQEIKQWNEKVVMIHEKRKELANLIFGRDFQCVREYTIDLNEMPSNTTIDLNEIPLELIVEVEHDDQVEWNSIRVLTEMYRFEPNKINEEEGVMRQLKGNLSYVYDNMELDKNNMIDDEVLGQNRNKLDDILHTINMIQNSSELIMKIEEGNKLLLKWLCKIEKTIFILVNDAANLLLKTCRNQVIVNEFRAKLQGLKRKERGRVPLLVYRILTLLEGELVVEEAMIREGDNRILFNKIECGYFLLQYYKMILLLTHVLNNIYLSTTSLDIYTKKKALLESNELVRKCDGFLLNLLEVEVK